MSQESESLLRERLDKSPLNFFLQRFHGNDKDHNVNLIPKPDNSISLRYQSRNENPTVGE